MASSAFLLLLLLLLTLSCLNIVSLAHQLQYETGSFNSNLVTNDASFEYWPTTTALTSSTLYDDEDDNELDLEEEENDMVEDRRSLYWRRYYISYGALSANRIPCPPRSGRSYYTPNCFKARGPVHPYTRGCSAITRCRG